MRFGLMLPSFSFAGLDYPMIGRLRDFATRAEAMGYEALWVAEHLLTACGLYGTAWLSPLDYDLEQLTLWEEEILSHFRGV
jgi:alkanesulfonate monooxygenase SsuD/methylene tetrahydromethanopterin reductase-like flavin-dependent oxidoreductase (luciferase family)